MKSDHHVLTNSESGNPNTTYAVENVSGSRCRIINARKQGGGVDRTSHRASGLKKLFNSLMAAIKFPFIKGRLDLIIRSLSILVWTINIGSLLLRYLSIAAPRAISISNLLGLGIEKQGIHKKT